MNGGKEIELKLQLDPADIAILLGDPLFTEQEPVARDLISTYFDTAQCALHSAGLSLRIRTSGGELIQTVKTESKAAASLFARDEWECAVSGNALELDDAPAIIVKALGKKRVQQLAPVFRVKVNRTTIVHESDRNCIELVVDQGFAIADGREMPIAEIELELLDGNREALFTLASRLSALVPLRLGVQSKSERGYALLKGKNGLCVKAEPITLSPDNDTASLFEAVAGSCVRQFRLNEDKLLKTREPLALHQARVALRRLRSALSTFTGMLEGPGLDRFRAGFRKLSSKLGTVRDVDVMIAKIDHEPALEQLRFARTQRYNLVLDTLNSAATRSLMLDFVEWISIGHWRTRQETSELRDASGLVTASRTLDRLRHKMKRRGKHLSQLDEHDLHRVRIIGKKVRYTAEFFADFYRSKKEDHRREQFLTATKNLQTALGHLNDLASGRALFDELRIADADEILATAVKSDRERLLVQADKAYHDLIEVKRFWR